MMTPRDILTRFSKSSSDFLHLIACSEINQFLEEYAECLGSFWAKHYDSSNDSMVFGAFELEADPVTADES